MERLASPYALETFSVLTGDPVLVVDLDVRVPEPERGIVGRARETLGRLACPTVALRSRASSYPRDPLVEPFDVVVTSEPELSAVVDGVHLRPLASLALVQLLRHNARLDIHEGLVAESLVYSTLQGGPEFRSWLAERGPARPSPRATGPAVRVERDGRRLAIELNRPERHNAFSAEVRDGLAEALYTVVADPSIAEVVVTGAGPSFCSGGDLDEFGTLPDPATAHAIRSTRNVARLLAACADRVRFELRGACVGAGIELPAFARTIAAAQDAFFQLPEVRMGLVPGAGGTVSLPRRIGRQRTAYLALSGVRLDARAAREWGLIEEVRA